MLRQFRNGEQHSEHKKREFYAQNDANNAALVYDEQIESRLSEPIKEPPFSATKLQDHPLSQDSTLRDDTKPSIEDLPIADIISDSLSARIEEKLLKNAPTEVNAVFLPPSPNSILHYDESAVVTSSAGRRMNIDNRYTLRALKKQDDSEDDGSFNLAKNYNFSVIQEQGGHNRFEVDHAILTSLKQTKKVFPDGTTSIEELSTTSTGPIEFIGGKSGDIQLKFPAQPLKAGDNWEWTMNEVPIRARLENFVEVQGRRCAKIRYEAAGPIPVHVKASNLEMNQEISDYDGIFYFDFDAGIMVAHKWNQSFSVRMRGFAESCSVTRHTILTSEETLKEKDEGGS
jgi:hypothetical protein